MEMTTRHQDPFIDCLVRDISYYASVGSEDGDMNSAATYAGGADEGDDTAEAPPPEDDDCCPICLHDDEEEGTTTTTTQAAWKRIAACGHRFHGACVERWLRVKLSCPVCRHPAAVATVEEILEIYGDYSDSFETSLRQVMAGPYSAGNSRMPTTAT